MRPFKKCIKQSTLSVLITSEQFPLLSFYYKYVTRLKFYHCDKYHNWNCLNYLFYFLKSIKLNNHKQFEVREN